MIQKRYILVITFLMVAYFLVSPGLAVPAAKGIHILTQNDGSQFNAILWGDEWLHGWETTDGDPIIFDETTQNWMYAIPGDGENMASSEKVVGKDSPPETISKHIRPEGKITSDILKLRTPDELNAHKMGIPANKAAPVTGTAYIPVILINFNDRSTTYSAANFTTLLFSSGNQSLKDYYEEVSYGTFSISPGPGGISGWYTSSQNHDYYGQNNDAGRDMYPGTLVREAVAAADPVLNFSPYDRDGDCYVDAVNIIHQGTDEAEGGPSTDIWSHSWTLTAAYYWGRSDGGEYITNDPCPAGGSIKVDNYVIQSETLVDGSQMTIGIFAHEFGHALGLPDLYDYTGYSYGVGDWSLMGGGNWNGISALGDTPAHPDAWSKSLLGWVSPIQVVTNNAFQIKNVEDNSEVYQLLDNPNGIDDWLTGTGKGEYFLVENRQKIGFDAALPGEGLLIWHVDESIGNNDNRLHKLVDLEEADGRNDLDCIGSCNSGDAFDPWYNKIVGFTATSTPDSHFYNNSQSGVEVTNIGASNATMSANLSLSSTPPPTVTRITPASGPNTGTVTITNLSGTNFVSGATVRLSTSGGRNPVHKGSITDGNGGAILGGPEGVFVSGTYAYVASYGSDALEIVDVSNPAAPVHKGSISNGTGGANLVWPVDVYVAGNYAYVTSFYGSALEIVDVSNPAAPVHKGSISDGDGGASLYIPISVYVAGNYAYVTDYMFDTLEIVDVSNPAVPVHKGSISDGDGGALLYSPWDVYVAGNYAYVTTYTGLEIVDVSNPAAPVHKGSISNGAGGALLMSPCGVYVSGNYAYIASYGSNALEIVDVSNPAVPVHKGSISNGAGGALLAAPMSVHVSGNDAFVVSRDSDSLEIVDVSNPAVPVHKGSIANGEGGALLDGPGSVYVSGRYAYVPAFYSDSLEIVELPTGTLTTITGAGVTVVSPVKITCNFSFNSTPSGKYDVIVSNPDGKEGTLVEGFSVGGDRIGVVRNSNTWLLDASGDGRYGPGDLTYVFGKAGDVYVTGDWNTDDRSEIGVVRNSNTWLLDASGDGKYGPGDLACTFGKAGDAYVTGDWNNDGRTEIGVVRNNISWLLDASGNCAYGPGDLACTFGKAGDVYVTGDWNNDGRTEIGVVRNSYTWLLDASGNCAYGPGDLADVFGKAGDKYVTGKWI